MNTSISRRLASLAFPLIVFVSSQVLVSSNEPTTLLKRRGQKNSLLRLAAFWMLLLICGTGRGQVSEVIAKDLGAAREVEFAMLGPANWRSLGYEERGGTRFGFVEAKTGRVIADLKGRGFSWFSDGASEGKGPFADLAPAVSSDRTKIAVMARWARSVDLALFEITGPKIQEIAFELPTFKDALRVKHPEIPSTRTLRFHTMSSKWRNNERLEVSLSGTIADADDKLRDVQVHCELEIRDGKAGVVNGSVRALFVDDPQLKKPK